MAIPVLPPSAPFTTEQRQYLNGFFAGLFGLEGGANSPNHGAVGVAHNDANFTDSTAALSGAAPAQNEPSGDESTPWHDPALALDERMELGKRPR
jgi:sulfite reductase (NADPH) flavoprotein alpha-component